MKLLFPVCTTTVLSLSVAEIHWVSVRLIPLILHEHCYFLERCWTPLGERQTDSTDTARTLFFPWALLNSTGWASDWFHWYCTNTVLSLSVAELHWVSVRLISLILHEHCSFLERCWTPLGERQTESIDTARTRHLAVWAGPGCMCPPNRLPQLVSRSCKQIRWMSRVQFLCAIDLQAIIIIYLRDFCQV